MEQSPPFAVEKFFIESGVSRETVDKLITYHTLLLKWQNKINLVSASTLSVAWERHFLDSAQLFNLLGNTNKSIFDLGSGAGFPGLVLSILGAGNVTLLESDQRKCAFLSEVIRNTASNTKVFNGRIEAMTNKAEMITSRACASLSQLFAYSYPLLSEAGECLFLKGRGAEEEIKEAEKKWVFHVEQFPSLIDQESTVLRVSGLKKLS